MDKANQSPWSELVATGPILRTRMAADYMGVSITNYYEKVVKGTFPAPLKLGGRASGVPKPWLDAVLAHIAEATETPR